MRLRGHCQTTAMGILPHVDVRRALDLTLSLDIPFWPQLPRLSFFEDMYVQVSENFPGMRVDAGEREIYLSLEGFQCELPELAAHWEDPAHFALSAEYSLAFRSFLKEDLDDYSHVRGQLVGPVSFGLRVGDEDGWPIIYNDEIRAFLFPFIQKKISAQLDGMRRRHPNPFVWIDEPGLETLFSAFTGYTEEKARGDYAEFLGEVPRPRGVHLCGNPDWSFLLDLDMEVLSIDALAQGEIFVRYLDGIARHIDRGGILCWGITPTLTEEMEGESVASTVSRLQDLWHYLDGRGLDRDQLLCQSWLAPARCCLINEDGEETVERSFRLLGRVSEVVRERYGLYD
ncbi:MAG: hypothetical protein R6U70_05590 [Bacillota bacterium]